MRLAWERCKLPPYAHQKVGVEALLRQPAFALFDQVGSGKSKQVADAAQFLHLAGQLDAVIAVAPGAVRSVWADPDPVLGEVAKHAFLDVGIHEYHGAKPTLPKKQDRLWVVVTNYEYVRRANRLDPLIAWALKRRTMVVFDESWMIKNPAAQQTKAARKLREACARAVILNGTPGDPGEVYSQFSVLDPAIIGARNWWTFRARFARMGGYRNKQIVAWERQDEFQAKVAPYALRRTTHDCIDLPPVSYTQIEARLTPETWRHYTNLRDDLITWLSANETCTAAQAGVKVIRLAQLTAGFLGGVETGDQPELGTVVPPSGTREVGREKLDAVLAWLAVNWPDSGKVVVWGRFRAELERAVKAFATAPDLQSVITPVNTRLLYGGQSDEERNEVKALLAPGGRPEPSIVVGTPQAGGSGLNFAASNLAIYMTNSFSAKDRAQSEGRLDRPGQTRPVLYVDVIAVGPNGERTVDHHVVASLRKKQDVSDMTARAWKQVLTSQ
jgi:SNF2 family DNA or RNA helicase